MCRKKQHVKMDDRKEMPDLICGKTAVGGNYNSTRDSGSRLEIKSFASIVACSANSMKLLVDVIQSSKFITVKKSHELFSLISN